MICFVCQTRIFAQVIKHEDEWRTTPYHNTYTSLKLSVEEGCYVCNLLWANLSPDELRFISVGCKEEVRSGIRRRMDETATHISARTSSRENVRRISLNFKLGKGSYDRSSGAFFTLLPYNNPEIEVSAASKAKLAPNTQSTETFSLAEKWIADCKAKHEHCKPNHEKPWYPTRLLDCGFSSGLDSCRLIETNTVAPTGPYMTLSHCWGKVDCLKLTTENSTQLQNGIPISSLPTLFQDSIYAARQLGISYLWIDSLCIIQHGDDSIDWQKEVTLMSEVYSNSYCNISAASAPDADHSMFNSRNVNAIRPEVVSLGIGSQNVVQYLIFDNAVWDREVVNAHVHTRAWVLQERLLSPRILHFGASQLFWECREKDAAEIFPDGLPSCLISVRGRFKTNFTPQHYAMNSTKVKAYAIWRRIVQVYTSCDLTFQSDKLAAISSIAKVMRPVLCDKYVAGMWCKDLENELLWWQAGGIPLPRPELYRAPSWSWAAVDSIIIFNANSDSMDPCIKVENVSIEYLTDDDTGLAKSGWLRLRGNLRRMILVPSSKPTPNRKEWNMVVKRVHVNNLELEQVEISFVVLDVFHGGFEKENAEETLYCMPGAVSRGENGYMSFLLLEVIDKRRGVFRRIGYASGPNNVAKKIMARGEEEEDFPCEEYRDGWHYIRII